MVTQIAYPVAPAITKPKGTLLDAANIDPTGFHMNDGRDLFSSFNCLRFDADVEFCAPVTKDLSATAGWVDGFRFAVYGGATCKAIGLDRAEFEAGISNAFENGESTGVARALMRTRFVESDGSTIPGVWDAPVDINPGGAVSPKEAIALMEEYAGSVYAGAPTLHVPISVASLVLGISGAVFEGNILRTRTGSKMAADAGYAYPNTGPDGTDAADGERWAYVTGEVYVAPGPMIFKADMDRSTNDVVALAERGYVAAVDCFVAAIRVNIEA